jgi:tetratricopeptide (TPR) repeat protein
MAQIDFYAGINKIVNYFDRTSKGGFLFCAHDKTLVLLHIAKTVIERAAQKKLDVKELYLTIGDVDDFWRKIREIAKEKPDGIIISNLDELIVLTKDQIIKDFNLSRDILLGFNVQILFCLTRENVAKFANQASDLYLRRDRGVIFFADPPEETTIDKFEEFYSPEFIESTDFKTAKLQIGLLEKQLKEARENKYRPDRIANEIALDLISSYLDSLLLEDADGLFNEYKKYFNLETNHKAIDIIGKYYRKKYLNDEALECFFKSKALNETVGNEREVIGTLLDIGIIYTRKRDLDKALEYYFQALEIDERKKYEGLAENVFRHIGFTFQQNGEYNKALDYYIRAMDIYKEKNYDRGLVVIYYNIGLIYYNKKEYDQALELFLKSSKIYKAIGRFKMVPWSLKFAGDIYLHKSQLKYALNNYTESLKLFKKVNPSNNELIRHLKNQISLLKKEIQVAKHQKQGVWNKRP